MFSSVHCLVWLHDVERMERTIAAFSRTRLHDVETGEPLERMERITAAFSNTEDQDKTVVVKDGKVHVGGVYCVVKWIGTFKDGCTKIVSVEDGKVLP